jgi:hypothetical protein
MILMVANPLLGSLEEVGPSNGPRNGFARIKALRPVPYKQLLYCTVFNGHIHRDEESEIKNEALPLMQYRIWKGEKGGGGLVLWRNRRGSFSSGMFCSFFIHSNIYFIVLSTIYATRISFFDIFEKLLWINELLSKFNFYNQFHHTFVIEISKHTQSGRLSVQSSELGPPPHKRVCFPPLGSWGEATLAGGVGGGGPNTDEGTGILMYTLIPLRV